MPALSLATTAPFDWGANVAFLRARAIPGVEAVEGDVYLRSVEIDGLASVIEVEVSRTVGAPSVRVRLDDQVRVDALEPRLRRWFDLDADLATIGAHLARDPTLAPFIAARPGLRVPGAWDPYELAVRAIVGQQISVAGARTIAGRLVERHGERLATSRGDIVRLFPGPRTIAAADLAAIGMPGARARAIVGLAAAVAGDPALLERSDDLDADVARLRALPGVGEWTAQYIALRGLKHADAFPASDIGILRALAGRDGRRPTPTEALALAERWRPYRAYAAQHLWSADSAT
jgi:AraC family transcriptional regulator of adaptative response / DNA-3-methyladenine glycosylase II